MSAPWIPSRPRSSSGHRAAARLSTMLPLLVWLSTIALLFWLRSRMPQSTPLPGLALENRTAVTTPAPGRVVDWLVPLHADVTKGQAVAHVAGDSAADAVTVYAPAGGRVLSFDVEIGHRLARGAAVLTLVDPVTTTVHAFLAEHEASRVEVGMAMRIARLDHGELGAGTITSISPAPVRMPARLLRDPQREQWAYEVIVTATGHEHPGERLLLLPVR